MGKTKTTEQADRVADLQHASDMAEQNPPQYEARAFTPFTPRNYTVTPYFEMVMEWDDEADHDDPDYIRSYDKLACLLSVDLMEMVAWSKVNAISADNHVLTAYHQQSQLIDGINVLIKQLGTALSTSFSPITIQTTTKEDLLAMKRNGTGQPTKKVDLAKFKKSGR